MFFFLVSFIYASVGFGGGSSYIAILAMYSLPYKELRLVALVLNIIVVAGGTFLYIRHRQIAWKKTLPLLGAGLLCAFLGASIPLHEHIFYIILGCSLVVAGVLLVFEKKRTEDGVIKRPLPLRDASLGAGIGLLSGIAGIGGGIFLSPVLNLLKWDRPKFIAAMASLFILLNSISGIAGQLNQGNIDLDWNRLWIMALTVFIGGQLGARAGIFKFNQYHIKKLTGILVFAAGIEVLVKHIG